MEDKLHNLCSRNGFEKILSKRLIDIASSKFVWLEMNCTANIGKHVLRLKFNSQLANEEKRENFICKKTVCFWLRSSLRAIIVR